MNFCFSQLYGLLSLAGKFSGEQVIAFPCGKLWKHESITIIIFIITLFVMIFFKFTHEKSAGLLLQKWFVWSIDESEIVNENVKSAAMGRS